MNEMNPGSFTFGPTWWAVFLALVALAVVAVMLLFLWQAGRERAPRQTPAEATRQPDRLATRQPAHKPIGRPA